MNWKDEWWKLALIVAVFVACFWLPVGTSRFDNGLTEALELVKWYAREHVLLCLVPAFFIAGAIGVFVSQASVMRYFGPKANKVLAYGVASVSGSILAVCSCTVLPLFAGIWRMGAGLGPATAFLYSGPAINVLAIILTARILGLEMGIARAVGAVGFSIVIGLIMHFIYRKEEMEKSNGQFAIPEPEVRRALWKNVLFFGVMVGVLVFVNWGCCGPGQIQTTLVGRTIYAMKWHLVGLFALALGVILILWIKVRWWKVVLAAIPPVVLAVILPMQGMMVMIPFAAAVIGLSAITSTSKGEAGDWFAATWGFTKQITPLLLVGVLVAGFLLGRPGHEGIIPGKYVEMLVGSRPDTFLAMTGLAGGGLEPLVRSIWVLWTNFFASVFGVFMYFATLTEVPILQGLMGAGMAKGPALALLLAGPAVSLPSMLVLTTIIGARKTLVYVGLVIAMATISGILFGMLF